MLHYLGILSICLLSLGKYECVANLFMWFHIQISVEVTESFIEYIKTKPVVFEVFAATMPFFFFSSELFTHLTRLSKNPYGNLPTCSV